MNSDEDEATESSLLGGRKPPKDRFHLVYCIMYVQGIGTLLPWNMFITANNYFDHKLKEQNLTSHNSTSFAPGRFEHNFENFFEVGFMVPNLTFLALNVLFKHHFSVKSRLSSSLTIILIGFIVTVALAPMNSYSWQDAFFGLTMAMVILVAMAGALYQSGVFGLAAVFHSHTYTSAVMEGQGLAGIFASLASIFSLLVGSTDEESGIVYFCCAIFVIVVSLLSFCLLPLLHFSRFYLDEDKSSMDTVVQESDKQNTQKRKPEFMLVFKRIWRPAVSVFITFFVTLLLFPAITSNIRSVSAHSSDSPWTSTYFIPLTCFLLFNCGDFTGRTIAKWLPLVPSKWLWLPAILRFGFIPLFVLCNVQPRSSPVVFNSDVFPVVFMTLMAISNGYLSTLAMMYAPSLVTENQRETAGTMMAFILGGGLAAGAAFSFALSAAIKNIA